MSRARAATLTVVGSRTLRPYRVPKTPNFCTFIPQGDYGDDPRFARPDPALAYYVVHGGGLVDRSVTDGDLLETRLGREVPADRFVVVELWDEGADHPHVYVAGYVKRKGSRARIRFAEEGVKALSVPTEYVQIVGEVVGIGRMFVSHTDDDLAAMMAAGRAKRAGGDHA